MGSPDYKALAAALKEECDAMDALGLALERERAALAAADLGALGTAASDKEILVLRLDSARARRRKAAEGSGAKGLRSLAKAAPAELSGTLGALLRRAADRAERVFLLNRGNGQVLAQGRAFLKQRMERLRFRGGRVVLYGRRQDYVSIGDAAIVQRDL